MAYSALTKYEGGDYFPVSQWNLCVDNLDDHESRIVQNESAISSSIALVGEVKTYAGSVAPTGHLECDGSAVSRTTYADLYTALGDSWGDGDGSTTFNIPDLRGRFLRGYDHGAGVDPDAGTRTAIATGGATGDNVGSIQSDQLQGHWHDVSMASASTGGLTGRSRWGNVDTSSHGQGSTNAENTREDELIQNAVTDGVNGTPRTGSETRSLNASIMYIIKY